MASGLSESNDRWREITKAAYEKQLAWMAERMTDEMFWWHAATWDFLGQERGEQPCNGFMSHEMWFGLMDHYEQDWPCPGCGAQI